VPVLNVLLATDYFPPHVGGGVEEVTYDVAEELVKLGHRVAVITLDTCNASPTEDLDGIHVYRARPFQLTGTLGVQSVVSPEVVKLMREVCRKEQSDVLHANNLYFFTTIAACLNLRALRKPLVTTLHIGSIAEMEGKARYGAGLYERSIGRWILRKSSRIVAVSQAVKRYAESLDVEPWKVSVVPNTVDTVKFRPAPQGDRRRDIVRVGFIGRLISNKGPQYLVDAAPRILRNFSNVQFTVAGNGPMLAELEHRVHQLGVENAFRFLGTVPSNAEFLKSCDVMVRPSLTDGMPLTVLEAMACGKPTVASRVGGTCEILQDGYTGFLVEPRNVDELVSRISTLVDDSNLRTEMGGRARKFVEKYYSWNQIATQISAIYEDVLLN
jgi:glycosyltransferase involved in cell wall biosynthesis